MFLSDLLLKKFSDNEVKVDNYEELQKEYLEKVSFIDRSENFITDKAPLNFFRNCAVLIGAHPGVLSCSNCNVPYPFHQHQV